jgi:hypothetical protein
LGHPVWHGTLPFPGKFPEKIFGFLEVTILSLVVFSREGSSQQCENIAIFMLNSVLLKLERMEIFQEYC